MLYITTALYCEAEPFIDYFHLKKDTAIHKFQVFENEDIILMITKPGIVQASVAVTYLCTIRPPKNTDLLLNIGICATLRESIPCGSLFLCNKIMDQATNRSYYPDLLYLHPFTEHSLMTCPMVVQKGLTDSTRSFELYGKEEDLLYDMEASGIYQAASVFLQPHQLIFLKVVSDYANGEMLRPEQVYCLIHKHINVITTWLSQIMSGYEDFVFQFAKEEEQELHKLCEDLKLSASMKHMLSQILHYYTLECGSFLPMIEDFRKAFSLPIPTKKEGKLYFELLKERLL
ncbi:MAG: hypothetical protein K0S47_1224 [Herbinix sp.]|jgi:nucleoside phosphorylase|nr:hypothetical protein [Herbinix sp.]